eukprot:2075822-Amphidinium_carterae.1
MSIPRCCMKFIPPIYWRVDSYEGRLGTVEAAGGATLLRDTLCPFVVGPSYIVQADCSCEGLAQFLLIMGETCALPLGKLWHCQLAAHSQGAKEKTL